MPKGKPQAKTVSQGSGKKQQAPTPVPDVKTASKKIQKQARPSASEKEDATNGPAKPLSSYAIFLKQMSAQMKNMPKFNDLTLSERAKVISESWSKLTADQKQQYVEMANNDKIRYQNECAKANIKQIDGRSQPKGAAAKAKVVVEEKKKKDDNTCMPKKALTAYVIFGVENGEKVKKQNPDIKVTEVMKANGEAWGKMTDKQKEPYVAKSNKDKERYEKEMKQFNELGYFINSDGVKSTDLDKKGRTLEFPVGTVMPKKKATPYLCFFKHYHENNKESLKGVSVTDTARKISEAWAALTDKSKFEKAAEQDVKRYDDQINQLKKNGFFMTEDGTKSSDLPAPKPKVKRTKKQE